MCRRIGRIEGIGPVTATALVAAVGDRTCFKNGRQFAMNTNMPGEASSVVTTLDGHAMARNGRAGKALGITAIGSFGGLALAALAVPLSRLALSFSSSHDVGLMVLGLTLAIVLAGGSLLKALCMLIIGVVMSLVGAAPINGLPRLISGSTSSMTASAAPSSR